MFLTVHATAGILIGQTLNNPVWSFFCALGSHYLLDIIPHGDEGIGRWIHDQPQRIWWIGLADLCLVSLIVWLFFHLRPTSNASTLGGALIGALLPDFLSETNYQLRQAKSPGYRFAHFITTAPFIGYVLEKHNRFHHTLHWLINRHLPWRLGLAIQFAMAVVFFSLALLK